MSTLYTATFIWCTVLIHYMFRKYLQRIVKWEPLNNSQPGDRAYN